MHLDRHDSLVCLQHGERMHSLAHHSQIYSYRIVNMLHKMKYSELPCSIWENKKLVWTPWVMHQGVEVCAINKLDLISID